MTAKRTIGIDLGTTNSCVATIDEFTTAPPPMVSVIVGPSAAAS